MEVRFNKSVLQYLEYLTDLLIAKNCFKLYKTSYSYVNCFCRYIKKNIHLKPKHVAPGRFSKYAKNMYYITCPRSRNTTWYVFFTIHGKHKDKYLVQYITNNHVQTKYVRGLK
jgi:hypothetical protein